MRQLLRQSILAFVLTLALSTVSLAQISPPTMNLKVFQGSNVTFTWDYLVADEATMTHFSLKWVDSLTGTFVELKTVPKSARSTSISAAFTPGFKFTYYAVTAVDATVPASPLESLPSNTVSTERIGKPPTNLRAN